MKKATVPLLSLIGVTLNLAQAQQYAVSTYAGVPQQPNAKPPHSQAPNELAAMLWCQNVRAARL
jgi:hypothetical protein